MRKILAFSMTNIVAVLLIASLMGVSAATEDEIEDSISLGLEWLSAQQQINGSWWYNNALSNACTDPSTTALVLLKFVDRAKELELDPFGSDGYEYADNVIAGFDYLFSEVISDTDGIHVNNCLEVYSTSTALMAISSTDAPGRVITTGPLTGMTYNQAAQGLMDWLVYAQNVEAGTQSCDVGGWGYTSNSDGWSDQSNTGYVTVALGIASAPSPDGFGLTIPGTVLTRLDAYIDNVQDPMDNDTYDGGSWYEPCTPYKWVNILKTGNILHEMALVGDLVDDTRVQNAVSYMENHWNDTGQQPEFPATSLGWKDSYQAMFTMMKGFEAFNIDTISVNGSDVDWFDEVSDVIIANQNNVTGFWARINPAISEGEESANLRAAWAMLTLERIVPSVTEPVYVDIKPSSCPNPLNTKNKGVLPAAILGTEEFHITMVDPETISITMEGSDMSVMPLRWNYEDVATPFEGELCDCHELGGDGYTDMTLKFKTQDLVNAFGLADFSGETIPLTITGNLKEEHGGTAFTGSDCVRIK